MAVLNLTVENFEKEVLQSDKVVLVDFFATWCGPCKMMAPIVEAVATEHPEYVVGKINTDEQQELAIKYSIMSIPTLMIFKNGKEVNKQVGACGKEQLESLLQQA